MHARHTQSCLQHGSLVVINKELKGAAAIADDGVLRLDTNVSAAINAIYSEY